MRLRWLALTTPGAFVLVAAVVAGAFAATDASADGTGVRPAGRADTPAAPPTSTGTARPELSEEQLHDDYDMTRYMASPDATGPMFTYEVTDPQLRHSRDPAFVRALEDHVAAMDRMLGRGQP